MQDIETAYQQAIDRMIEHAGKYNLTCEAAVVATIKLKFEGGQALLEETPTMQITADVQVKAPKRPARVTKAFQEVDQTGRVTLFTPGGGSTAGNPRQAIIQDAQEKPIV